MQTQTKEVKNAAVKGELLPDLLLAGQLVQDLGIPEIIMTCMLATMKMTKMTAAAGTSSSSSSSSSGVRRLVRGLQLGPVAAVLLLLLLTAIGRGCKARMERLWREGLGAEV
jgi:hypothetical protein